MEKKGGEKESWEYTRDCGKKIKVQISHSEPIYKSGKIIQA